jgi:hypothetical protein
MLLPDSSDNMTKILLDMSELSNTPNPTDDDVLTRMGKWFTGNFGNVMGILSFVVPVLICFCCVLIFWCLCKWAVKNGIMVLPASYDEYYEATGVDPNYDLLARPTDPEDDYYTTYVYVNG